MVLPAALLSSSEAVAKQLVNIRLRYYFRSLVLPSLERALERGSTEEEWAADFVAALEGPLPPVFAPDGD